MGSEKEKKLVSSEEEQDISRKMMVWVNSFSDDDLPAATINYEFLAADSASVALSVIQGAYITKRYLLGGHEAEYQFKIIARIKPGGSNEPLRGLGDEELSVSWRWRSCPSHGSGQPRGGVRRVSGRVGRPSNLNEDEI